LLELDFFDGTAVAKAIHSTSRARLGRQIRPSKTKQKCLDSLGFIRPNRDFSMSYGKKNKKIPVSWFLAAGVSQDAGSISRDGKRIPLILIFAKELQSGYSRPVSSDSVQTYHALNRRLPAELTVANQAAGFRLVSEAPRQGRRAVRQAGLPLPAGQRRIGVLPWNR
jgi:hypothetical protein